MMRVSAVVPSLRAREAVFAIADATGLSDDQVREFLPMFLADGVEVELDALRRVRERQEEFVAYVMAERAKVVQSQTAPLVGAAR